MSAIQNYINNFNKEDIFVYFKTKIGNFISNQILLKFLLFQFLSDSFNKALYPGLLIPSSILLSNCKGYCYGEYMHNAWKNINGNCWSEISLEGRYLDFNPCIFYSILVIEMCHKFPSILRQFFYN
jgi:hypothetical protein